MTDLDFRNCLHDWREDNPRGRLGVSDTEWKRLAVEHCRQEERGYYSERIEPSRAEGYSRANYVQYHEIQYHTMPVRDELQHSKQTKLNRVKERYAWMHEQKAV